MVVADASAVVDFLLQRDEAGLWAAERLRTGGSVRAPHVVDAEVVSGLRRLVAAGEVSAPRATAAVEDFLVLRVIRYQMTPLLLRMWELRRTLSAYDASYVALAEALGATLVTTDARLGRSHGHRARVEAFPG